MIFYDSNNKKIFFIVYIKSLRKGKIPKSFLFLEEIYIYNNYIQIYINNELYTIYIFKYFFFK